MTDLDCNDPFWDDSRSPYTHNSEESCLYSQLGLAISRNLIMNSDKKRMILGLLSDKLIDEMTWKRLKKICKQVGIIWSGDRVILASRARPRIWRVRSDCTKELRGPNLKEQLRTALKTMVNSLHEDK